MVNATEVIVGGICDFKRGSEEMGEFKNSNWGLIFVNVNNKDDHEYDVTE